MSTGALAAPFAFLGPAYDDALTEIYTAYGDSDLYTSKGPLGFIGTSMNDTAPLRRLIERYVTEEMLDRIAAEGELGRRLLVQTTNLDAQRPTMWDLTTLAASRRLDRRDIFIRILMASSAVPAVFPPQRIRMIAASGETYEELHVDGGVASQMFFAPPQVRLEDYERAVFGHTRTRTLYVIRNGKLGPEYAATEEKTLSIATRAIAMLVKGQVRADLGNMVRAARESRMQLHYTSIPENFSETSTDLFDRSYMRNLFEIGLTVGRTGQWSSGPAAVPL